MKATNEQLNAMLDQHNIICKAIIELSNMLNNEHARRYRELTSESPQTLINAAMEAFLKPLGIYIRAIAEYTTVPMWRFDFKDAPGALWLTVLAQGVEAVEVRINLAVILKNGPCGTLTAETVRFQQAIELSK